MIIPRMNVVNLLVNIAFRFVCGLMQNFVQNISIHIGIIHHMNKTVFKADHNSFHIKLSGLSIS